MPITIRRGNARLLTSRWQKEIAAHLTLAEVVDRADIPEATADFFHDGLLLAWELVRKAWGKPIKVNSGLRSEHKQAALKEAGYRAARISPHVPKWEKTASGIVIYRPGLALDLDTASAEESRLLAQCIRQTVPSARIFWSRYLSQTFVHFDVAPLLRFRPEAWLAPGENALPPAWLQPGIGD